MATRKRAPSKATGKAVMSIDEQLAAEAAAIRGKIQAPSGRNIRILRSGEEFDVPGIGPVSAPMKVVVVGFTNRNDFYEGAFDANNISPPDCFAIGDEFKTLAPDASVREPEGEDCATCPLNQWGSDGKGKACKNQKIVAVLPPDSPEADILVVKVSPTGLKEFDGMVNTLIDRWGKVPVQAVAELGIKPAGVGYAFSFGLATDENSQPILNPNVGEFLARSEEAQTIVTAKPGLESKEAPPPKKTTRRGATSRRRAA